MSLFDRADAEVRIESLSSQIRDADRLYFLDDSPSISDQTYDALRRELREIETSFPDLMKKESPSPLVPPRINLPS